MIGRRVTLVEEERTDDVPAGSAGVVEGHHDGFLGCAGGVADDPGDYAGTNAFLLACFEGAITMKWI